MYQPYSNPSVNFIYNLLFCEDPEPIRQQLKPPYEYPYSVLFNSSSTISDLQTLVDDHSVNPRIKLFAIRKQQEKGATPQSKELMAVIVEIGLDQGPDVLASFADGTARYINQSGKLLIWESTSDSGANTIKDKLFEQGRFIIGQIGPWDKARKEPPAKGTTRISFLVSDGLYFGEAPSDVLFGDAMAGPALASATELLQYLIEKEEGKS